jgi:hypothetical protein
MILDAAGTRACMKTCSDSSECREGYACDDTHVCIPRCMEGSCTEGASCDAESGVCVADTKIAPANAFPTPACDDVPPRDCADGADCNRLEAFEPVEGRGYENYPLNGETAEDQYRSFARRDLRMLIQHAAAWVDCKASSWRFGNKKPLGLGDMSEKDGSIPGTRDGSPGHPAGTHVNGFDMDVAYFQLKAKDNRLRPICEHRSGPQDAYHCIEPPHDLDVWRTTLMLGQMVTSKRVRVIGVDGQVGPLLEKAAPTLCKLGFLEQAACSRFESLLAYETTNGGAGWYYFHHHHWHVSLKPPAPSGSAPPEEPLSLDPAGQGERGLGPLLRSGAPGHAFLH